MNLLSSLSTLWDAIWHYSLRRKIFIFTMLMIMIPILVIGLYFIHAIQSIITNNNYREFQRLADNVQNNLASQFDLIENTYYNLISDPSFRDHVDKLHTRPQSLNQINEWIDLRMQSFLYFNYPWNSKLLQSIFVFIDEETSYFYDYNYMYYNNFTYNNEDRNKSMAQMLGLSWAELRQRIVDKERINKIVAPTSENGTLFYARDFYDIHTRAFKGLIVLGVDEAILSNFYHTVLPHEQSIGMIFDKQGTILSHSDKSKLGTSVQEDIRHIRIDHPFEEVTIDQEVYLAASRPVDNRGATVVIAIPKKYIFSDLVDSVVAYFFLIAILCLLFIVIGFILTSKVSRQITRIIKKMEIVQFGNFDVRMESYKEFELEKLSRIFNAMTSRIHYLFNEVYQKKLLLKEAELKALQAQINPHFLFNTLLCIGWKAKMSGDEEVATMVASLSQLMESSIYTDSNDTTSIDQELGNVELYLYLQQVRFANKIEVHVEVAPHIRSYCIPKLILQPIVENAILHGLENKIGPWRLMIRGFEREQSVLFEIEDNGIGFDATALDLNNEETSGHRHWTNTPHIGLSNTNKRIKYSYGEQYGLTVISKPGEGTKVTVQIPVDRGEVHDIQSINRR